MSDKPKKEFLHIDVETDTRGTYTLANWHNAGWELYSPAQWDSSSRVWRVLLYRDDPAPVPVAPVSVTPTLIAETAPTDNNHEVDAPAIPPKPVTEETPIEAESTDTPQEPTPVIIVAFTPPPSLNFVDELRRIRKDKSLSPVEKTEAIKRVGDEIALAKARQAGLQAWEVWNRLYPVNKPSFLLPAEAKS